jgi:hypothetical protein
MIQRPTRSVTRFFIPLIDVMILLFCISLLMPFMSEPGNAEATNVSKPADDPEKTPTPDEMKTQIAALRSDLELARREIKKLQDEKANPTERLSICVLEIDPKNGRLYILRNGERMVITDQRTAQDVIDDFKRRAGVTKDPYFLILLPREQSDYPDAVQFKEYQSWFADVPHRFDNPLKPVRP